MTSKTISTTITTGISLADQYTTITPTGAVTNSTGDAVFGPAGEAWTLVSQGSVGAGGTFTGVHLLGSGAITNAAGGRITGYTGVSIGGTAATLANAGFITGSGTSAGSAGVLLSAGGAVSNAAGGAIAGYDGIYAAAGRSTVINAGSLDGTTQLSIGSFAGSGILLHGGGYVSNAASGVISGIYGVAFGYGITNTGPGGTVVNAGSILGVALAPTLFLEGDSTVDNAVSGLLQGYSAVDIFDGSGTVINAGSLIVTDTQEGQVNIELGGGGYLSNAASGVIAGAVFSVDVENGAGTVINAGSITGAFEIGVQLGDGGFLSNAAQGVIAAGVHGVDLYGSTATVANAGTIMGTDRGIDLGSASYVSNASSGLILGYDGVFAGGSPATIVNAGTITGVPVGSGNSYAISVSGSVSNLVVVDPGAVFNGTVAVRGAAEAEGSGSRLELAAARTSGTISGIGSSFAGFGTITVDSGATWAVDGANTIASASTLTALGTLTGSGTIELAGASLAAFDAPVAATETIAFTANTGTLGVGDPSDFAATVLGLQYGDDIDFSSVPTAGQGSISAGVDVANQLTLSNASGTLASIQLDPAQDFAGIAFGAVADGHGGTLVTETTPCFCAGTRIRTPFGDIAVERLAVGDRVLTVSGVARPIRWIGRRSYRGRFIRGNRDVLPIRIRAGALAENVPSRDLLLSPLHALFIDGLLVPAGELVNDRSIEQITTMEEIHYYHIELDSHDVVLAEGAPAESFEDDDSRLMFHNAAEYWATHPATRRRPARYCAPRVTGGYELQAIRRRIAGRAGLPVAAPRVGALRGYLEVCSPNRIAGWAQDLLHLDAPVCLLVMLDGSRLADILAGQRRPDLVAAGIGCGRHGFAYAPAKRLPTAAVKRITVVRAADGAALPRFVAQRRRVA